MALRRINLVGGPSSLPSTTVPGYRNHYVVTAAKTITVPAGAFRMVLCPDANIWWAADGTAAVVPAGDVTDGTGSAFWGAGQTRIFEVSPADTLSVISASGTANVGVEFWGA